MRRIHGCESGFFFGITVPHSKKPYLRGSYRGERPWVRLQVSRWLCMRMQFVRVPTCEAGCVLGSLCASPKGGSTASHELCSFPEDVRPSNGSILFVTDFNMYMHPLDILLGCRFLVCRSNQFLGVPKLWNTQLVQHQLLGMEVSF